MSSPDLSSHERAAARGAFGTWNGRESFEIHEGVRLHAIGGEQVLLCRVVYAPGKRVPWHTHEHTEQVMYILQGSVEVKVEKRGSGFTATVTLPRDTTGTFEFAGVKRDLAPGENRISS